MADTREEVLSRNAERFAKAYYDNAALNGAPMVPPEREAFEKGKDAYVDWMARAMYAKMAADPEYTEENWNDAKAARLDAFKDIEGASYAMAGGKSPEQKDYERGWEKFRPLVENGEWYRMGPAAMTLEMTKLGYDNKDPQSRNQFWNDLGKYDRDYNKTLAVDEFANSGWGKMNAVLNRTAYKEAMEQALGDKPYDEGAVWTGFGIDRARDAMMAPAMAMGGVVKPALAMGAADAASQYMAAAGLGQTEYSPEETLLSMGAGATIVPGFRYGTRWLSKVKNPKVAEFGREMNRGARNYVERDYVTEEANALKQELLAVRKEQQAIRDGKLVPGTPKYDAAMERLTAMEDKLRVLGFNGKEFSMDPNGDTYQQLASARNYLAEVLNGQFKNTPPGKGISLPSMLGYNGGEADEPLQMLEAVYRSPRTYNVSRPTQEQVATYRAAEMLGIDPNKAVFSPEYLSQAEQKAVARAANAQMDNAETAAQLDQILQQGAERRSALRQNFPAMSKRLEGKDEPKGRTVGSAVGSGISNTLGLMSGSEGLDLVEAARAAGTIGDDRSVLQDKIDAFKQSDWYRNLPEDRKNVIDYAFKKAAEERKKKGK